MTAIAARRIRFAPELLVSIAIAVASVGCGEPEAKSPSSSATSPLIGSPAPELDAEKVVGDGPSTLKDASGKVVVVDFWGTYCEPCRKSFPKYQELSEKFNGDLVIIAVSMDEPEDKGKIADFVKATGVKFAVVWDKDKSAGKKYNPPSMPTSFIIDKEGVVRHMHSTYHAGDEAQIAEEVKALLK